MQLMAPACLLVSRRLAPELSRRLHACGLLVCWFRVAWAGFNMAPGQARAETARNAGCFRLLDSTCPPSPIAVDRGHLVGGPAQPPTK